MRAPALALAHALAAPAIAGGYEGPGASGRAVPDCVVQTASLKVCVPSGWMASRADVRRRGVLREVPRKRPRVEYVQGQRCLYPGRPGDSVVSGVSDYIIRDHVRADLGCAS